MTPLFPDLAPQALRQPRSDRLILGRLLDKAGDDKQLDAARIAEAHEILIRWADLESSGRLADLHENQLQGDFLREVFGDALGYIRKTEGQAEWNLEQHRSIGAVAPDGVLGRFRSGRDDPPVAVIELKGPDVHPDRDRSGGRTAVQQCWDYLGESPETRWGIVSNIVSFRLYERNRTPRRYEHFALQDLRDERTFRRFFALFERGGLLDKAAGLPPRAERMLTDTENRQRTVGGELYDYYRAERQRLIRHLLDDLELPLDTAIGAAQQLLDRIIFIAFCEDRELLPERTLRQAYEKIAPYEKATNPRWRNFLRLFRAVDEGGVVEIETGYNGGLFAQSLVDEIDLDDRWTTFFLNVGNYDFRDEVNLDVLGHLFEKSVTELEKLREGDLFGGTAADADGYAQMPQSARRRRLGIYYTPPDFTALIAELTVEGLIAERFATAAEARGLDPLMADTPEYWRACFEILRDLKICDPACGSGAFLFQAYEVLESRYGEVQTNLQRHEAPGADELAEQIPDIILRENLYGVDLSPEAVEITQLALWIRTARRGHTLADLSHNIRCGNSLVEDEANHPKAFDWETEFPEVFGREQAGFDCVIGNPPWERMKLQEREFFALSAPEIATATNAARRRELIRELETANPELYARYRAAQEDAERALGCCRNSGRYPLTGKGDVNTYAVFAELASIIVAPAGRVGLLVPSGIATDSTTQDFFGGLCEAKRLRRVWDFENRKGLFADVHRSFKFCILGFDGPASEVKAADFVFFAHATEDLHDKRRHIPLSGDDIALLNPNTRTCPIFRTRRDAQLTKSVYERVPVLIDRRRNPPRNEWGLRFLRMFDQTNDAELFLTADKLSGKGCRREGAHFVRGKASYLPLYEAKMVQVYDHRAAGVIVTDANWVRQGQTDTTTLVEHQDLDFVTEPRFWVAETDVGARVDPAPAFLAFKDITSPTNQRTMIASFVPYAGFTNHCVLVIVEQDAIYQACLLANLNSFVFDYIARQKIGGITLNFFIVEQLPALPPFAYDERCPWAPKQTLAEWIAERVFKLTCTARDMLPLAEAAGFSAGDADGGRLNRWKPEERATLLAELNAAYFILYGIEREDAEYMLSTFQGVTEQTVTLGGASSTAGRVLDAYDWLRASTR